MSASAGLKANLTRPCSEWSTALEALRAAARALGYNDEDPENFKDIATDVSEQFTLCAKNNDDLGTFVDIVVLALRKKRAIRNEYDLMEKMGLQRLAVDGHHVQYDDALDQALRLSLISSVHESLRVTQWETLKDKVGQARTDDGKRDLGYEKVLIVSGESGSGKTRFSLWRAHEMFALPAGIKLCVTFYTVMSHEKEFRTLASGLAEQKDERDAACAVFVSNMVHRATKQVKVGAPYVLHIVLDEVGVNRVAIRGIVSSAGKWATEHRNVRVTLCGTGLDRYVGDEMQRSDPGSIASNPMTFFHLRIVPWTEDDIHTYLGEERWKEINRYGALVALAKNARCACHIKRASRGTPYNMMLEVARAYRDNNGLQNMRPDDVKKLIQNALLYALDKGDMTAPAAVWGIAVPSADDDELWKANGVGVLWYNYRSTEHRYEMTCAMLVLCIAEFGMEPASMRSFDGFEDLAGLYFVAMAVAMGVSGNRIEVVRLPSAVPTMVFASYAAEKYKKAPKDEVYATLRCNFPKDLVSMSDKGLEINGCDLALIVNGSKAPAFDFCVGRRVPGQGTPWIVGQAKFTAADRTTPTTEVSDGAVGTPPTAKPAALTMEDIDAELAKLGISEHLRRHKVSDPLAEDWRCRPSPPATKTRRVVRGSKNSTKGSKDPEETMVKLLHTSEWIRSVMDVRLRCVVSNAELKEEQQKDMKDFGVRFVHLTGPFGELASLLAERMHEWTLTTEVQKTANGFQMKHIVSAKTLKTSELDVERFQSDK